VQQTLVVFTQLPHVLHFLLGLQAPQEVQPGRGLPLESHQRQEGVEEEETIRGGTETVDISCMSHAIIMIIIFIHRV